MLVMLFGLVLSAFAAPAGAQAGSDREFWMNFDITYPRLVADTNVRMHTAPWADAPVDTILELGHPLIVNRMEQPTDTSWVYVNPLTGRKGYVRTALTRQVHMDGGLATLETIIVDHLQRRGSQFTHRYKLFELLTEGLRTPTDREMRGRLALLWIRSLRELLDSMPSQYEGTPYARLMWGNHHIVVRDDAARVWRISNERLREIHDEFRATWSADEIAWMIRENGVAVACRGAIACEMSRLDTLDGEYLRQHPTGTHAGEALARIRLVAERSMTARAGTPSFRPSRDCPSLLRSTSALRTAVTRTESPQRASTLSALARLARRCPSAAPALG
jgi:hypothetical protein